MTRVCLECGTPKFPLKETCQPCGKVTITHEGEERKKLCTRCKSFLENDQGYKFCYYTYVNHSKLRNGGIKDKISYSLNDKMDIFCEATTRFSYKCREFKPISRDPGTSENPLSFRDREEIRSWHNNPTAFWLDPKRWDHVVDPQRDVIWDPPKPKTFLQKMFGRKSG